MSRPASGAPRASADASAEARARLYEVLVRADPTEGLLGMVTDGFFGCWIPEMIEMQMEQDPVHRHEDVRAHTVAVTTSTPPQLRLRCAAPLHDIGKPATRRIGRKGVTVRHHEERSSTGSNSASGGSPPPTPRPGADRP